MDRRENVLVEALQKNAAETERWQAFKTENETTVKSLEMFAKQLTVQVMVPIGSKALMPGELIHTNELLVGHYQGYFSTCSAHKAKEICQHRIHLAEDHLKKLDTEADLWQNKLNTPLLEGAVPSGEQIDIVEEYSEEAHNEWLVEHKKRVRKQKQEERIKREAEANDENVFKKLEEREMLEELGIEPDASSENTLDMLLQSMAIRPTGTIQETDAHSEKNDEVNSVTMSDEQVFKMLDKLESEDQTETADISTDVENSIKATNEMVRSLMAGEREEIKSTKKRISKKPNQVNDTAIDNIDWEEMSSADDEDVPEEVQIIRKEMTLLPTNDHVEFLNSQLNIIKAKMRKMRNENHINNELNHLLNVVVYLEDDLQELIHQQDLTISDEDLSCDIEPEMIELADNKKRRISFALSDEKIEFRENETVAEMLPKANQISRDVIQLDASLQHVQTPMQNTETKVVQGNPSSEIMRKVEQNLDFVKENQSMQAFDLVNQILEPSSGRINTLNIRFTHSDAVPAVVSSCDPCDNVPGSPEDLYTMYSKARAEADHTFPIYVNSFEGEEHLKVPFLMEAARETAYEDPRKQFSKTQGTEKAGETKSILRNKSAVEQEPKKLIETKKKKLGSKKKNTIEDSLVNMSAYTKVMNDLVEREIVAPEPLPEGKFIDAHTPKKRISRFKEQRLMRKS